MRDKPIRPSATARHPAAGAKIRSVHTPLNELRLHQEITVQELADELDVSSAAVHQFLRGKDPRIGTLKRYVEALGGTLKITVIIDENGKEWEL